MNKAIIILLSAFIYGSCIEAALYETTPRASEKAIWFFEIKNKDKKNDIWIELENDRGEEVAIAENKVHKAQGSKESQQGYLRIEGLDPYEKYTLYIYKKDPKKTALPDSAWIIAPNKNRSAILVKYQNGKIVPQEGRFTTKLTGNFYSQSGIATRRNVRDADISKITPQR